MTNQSWKRSIRGSYRINRFINRVAPKALILLYHRVSEQSSDPQLLCVTPDHFAEHMQILRQHYHPLSLQDLRKRRALNFWPQGSAVVTFDDGYADNFLTAQKVLEKNDVPATMFVTSGMLDTHKEFWWDEVERILFGESDLPQHLNLVIENKEYSWKLDSPIQESIPLKWDVSLNVKPNLRQQAYLDVMRLLHGMDVKTREYALTELRAWAKAGSDWGREGHFAVTSDLLRTFDKKGIIEIGAHTVNHPLLASISLTSQKEEIQGGKTALEEVLGYPVDSFAYPFGEHGDYSEETVKLVQEAGFKCACSNFPGRVNSLRDPYQLPRFVVRDWDGETFTRQLEAWFHG